MADHLEAPSVNASLSAWHAKILPVNPALARGLTENKNPYAIAASLDLPVPTYRLFATITDFYQDPAAGLAPLQEQGIHTFYVGGRSDVPDLVSFRNADKPLNADEIVPFIDKHVKEEDRPHYLLRIAHYLMGVCVVAQIKRSGLIELDIAEGTLPPLTTGKITPHFTASNARTDENLRGGLQYFGKVRRNEDGEYERPYLPPGDETFVLNTPVRTAIWSALSRLPVYNGESDTYKQRLPGRYELAIVKHRGLQVPIFAEAHVFDINSIE